ncbi:hypothetical protein PT281_04750 [Lactobacillus sp. ESL0701]|nr:MULTISPECIES: hypothetical protein [unclassified Lactobacillus]MDF7668898.1 hypothetical protein [Lactobacillus sp. ESL0703]MDF7672573.1 hypothetical protein [Lactobacillus sp. ESL0701]
MNSFFMAFVVAFIQKLATWSFEEIIKLISHFIRNHGGDKK